MRGCLFSLSVLLVFILFILFPIFFASLLFYSDSMYCLNCYAGRPIITIFISTVSYIISLKYWFLPLCQTCFSQNDIEIYFYAKSQLSMFSLIAMSIQVYFRKFIFLSILLFTNRFILYIYLIYLLIYYFFLLLIIRLHIFFSLRFM